MPRNPTSTEAVRSFITAKELAGIMQCSVSKAYQTIQQLNKELEQKGYLVVKGKTPRAFFEERFGLRMDKIS